MTQKTNARAVAAKILAEIFTHQQTLTAALEKKFSIDKNLIDKSFIQELCYGVMRWHFQLQAILKILLQKPLKAKDNDIYALLLIGLYQLIHLNTPPHAAVHETVQAARDLKKIWAANLINGVLRQFQRQQETLMEKIAGNPSAKYAHPKWLLKMLQQAWPNDWETIANENNRRPPMSLRVNLLKQTREEYLRRLAEEQIAAHAVPETTAGIILETAQDVFSLPGFKTGDVSVQDAAAQLAAEFLMLAPDQRVLDACAAPGGKTAHILEIEPRVAELIAIDVDERRLEKIAENLQRLNPHRAGSNLPLEPTRGENYIKSHNDSETGGLRPGGLIHPTNTKLLCADATQTQSWWDGKLFDRILLDAPCSATGVIRRHPDIKYLRHAEDIETLAALQLQLLEALWPLLKPQGILLYVTCSILPQENVEVIQKFLERHTDSKTGGLRPGGLIHPTTTSEELEKSLQIFPGNQNMDGFFYARLVKTATL